MFGTIIRTALILILWGCRPSDTPTVTGSSGLVTITLVGGVSGPGKTDGTSWETDGPPISPGVRNALDDALLDPNPVAAVSTLYSGPLIAPLAQPDVYGFASISWPGFDGQSRQIIPPTRFIRDTLLPVWVNQLAYGSVSLENDVRIRVELWDRDSLSVNDDQIGVATIRASDLQTALDLRRVHSVDVSGQTGNQIVFLSVSVVGD